MVEPLTRDRASAILSAAAGKRVLVVGDVILDHYVEGSVTRVSPEAPVPVLKVEREWYALGGAANVASNISSLGATSHLMSVVGKDYNSNLDYLLWKAGGSHSMTLDDSHTTTIKTRYLTSQQPLLRVDLEDTTPLSSPACGMLRIPLTEQLIAADMVVVSDYAKGVVTQELMDIIDKLCHEHKKPLLVAPKGRKSLDCHHRTAWVCLNKSEYTTGYGPSLCLEQIWFRTEGADGITVLEGLSGCNKLAALNVPVVDVCGAGDTVLAMVAMARLGGATPVEAAQLANVAAAVVVGKKGTATASVEEVLEMLT